MAEKRGRPRKVPDPREDWVSYGPTKDADDVDAIGWNNVKTGEVVALPPGVHPVEASTAAHALALRPNAGDIDSDDEELPEEESPVDRIRAQLHGSNDPKASVKLYRVRPDGVLGFCRSYTPDEFDLGGLDLLARQWGPGTYRVRLYAQNPKTNKTSLYANELVQIEESAEPLPAAAAEPSTLSRLLEKMDQRLSAIEAAKPDPMAEMQRTLALFSTVKEILAPPPAPAQPSPASTIKEVAEMFGLLKMVREEIEPPPPPPDDPLSAALPKMLDIIAGAQKSDPEQSLPMVNVPALSPPEKTGQNAANENTEPDMTQVAFQWLTALAKTDADIEQPADMIYEQAPDELIALLKAPNWFDQLAAIHPKIAPFRAWFTKLRDRVLQIYSEENNPPQAA